VPEEEVELEAETEAEEDEEDEGAATAATLAQLKQDASPHFLKIVRLYESSRPSSSATARSPRST
jgi:hypothetical protein